MTPAAPKNDDDNLQGVGTNEPAPHVRGRTKSHTRDRSAAMSGWTNPRRRGATIAAVSTTRSSSSSSSSSPHTDDGGSQSSSPPGVADASPAPALRLAAVSDPVVRAFPASSPRFGKTNYLRLGASDERDRAVCRFSLSVAKYTAHRGLATAFAACIGLELSAVFEHMMRTTPGLSIALQRFAKFDASHHTLESYRDYLSRALHDVREQRWRNMTDALVSVLDHGAMNVNNWASAQRCGEIPAEIEAMLSEADRRALQDAKKLAGEMYRKLWVRKSERSTPLEASVVLYTLLRDAFNASVRALAVQAVPAEPFHVLMEATACSAGLSTALTEDEVQLLQDLDAITVLTMYPWSPNYRELQARLSGWWNGLASCGFPDIGVLNQTLFHVFRELNFASCSPRLREKGLSRVRPHPLLITCTAADPFAGDERIAHRAVISLFQRIAYSGKHVVENFERWLSSRSGTMPSDMGTAMRRVLQECRDTSPFDAQLSFCKRIRSELNTRIPPSKRSTPFARIAGQARKIISQADTSK